MTASPRRQARRDPGGAKVTTRDLLVLQFVAKAQPVATHHLQALMECTLAIARRVGRRLRDLGLLHVHVPDVNGPNYFTLAGSAPPILARVFDRDPSEFPASRAIGKFNLPHHGGVVDVYAALQVATARSHRLRLLAFHFECDLRRTAGNPHGVQFPDAAALFEEAGGVRFAVAFEVDLGTENPSYVATTKAVPYAELARSGEPLLGERTWRVCCTAPTQRRLNRLAAASWEAGVPEGLWYYAIAPKLNPQVILGASWLTPRVISGSGEAALALESPFRAVITARDLGDHGRAARESASHQHPSPARPGPFAHGGAR